MTASNDPRAAAIAYLAGILADPKAKASDRQRAAEAILRADPAQGTGRKASAQGLTDAELEAAARGEGGRPPEKGPVDGTPKTGPIREGANNQGPISTPLATSQGPTAAGRGAPPPGLGLLNSISGKGGPKLGPIAPESRPATPISPPKAKRIEKGPKKDEDIDPLS
jgi:hypothetical protein